MIRVKKEQDVQSFDEGRVRSVVWFVEVIEHVEKRFGIAHSRRWKDERSTLTNSVCHRGEGRRFPNDSEYLFVHDLERFEVPTSEEGLTLKGRIRVRGVGGKRSQTRSKDCPVPRGESLSLLKIRLSENRRCSHWMRVEPKSTNDLLEISVDHRVVKDLTLEELELALRRQFSVE